MITMHFNLDSLLIKHHALCLSTSYYLIFLCLTVEIRQENRFGLPIHPEEVNAVLLIGTNVAGIG